MGCLKLTYQNNTELRIISNRKELTSNKSVLKERREYIYGMNGMEMDNEINGVTGSSYTAEFWQYDSRTGRRWNVDPVNKPWESDYAAFNNNPIVKVDPRGNDPHEFDVNSETGDVTKVSDKGGNETQHFNIKDGSGNLLSKFSAAGNNISVTHSSADGLAINVSSSSGGFGSGGNNNGFANTGGVEGGFSLGLAKDEFVGDVFTGGALSLNGFSETFKRGSKFNKVTTGTVDFAKEAAAAKYFAKGAKFLGKAANVVAVGSIAYDFGTGTANTSTLVDGAVLIGTVTAGVVIGIAAAPYIAAVGIAYGTAVVFGFDDYLNEQFDISESINFITP